MEEIGVIAHLDQDMELTLDTKMKESRQSEKFLILFNVVWQFRTTILLFVDIITHFFNLLEDPTEWEFYSTFFLYTVEVLLLILNARTSSDDNFFGDIILAITGAYRTKKYLDRNEKDEKLYEELKNKERDGYSMHIIKVLLNLTTNEVEGENLEFQIAMIHLPMELLKFYFAIFAPSTCAFDDLIRILLILSIAWDIGRSAARLEEKEAWFNKIYNIYDFLNINVPGDKIKPFPPTNWLAKAVSSFSKFWSMFIVLISFAYFIGASIWLAVIYGVQALVFSFCYQVCHKPDYMNPPFGICTKVYILREVLASLFFIRKTRFSRKDSFFPALNFIYWHCKLWIQFVSTLIIKIIVDEIFIAGSIPEVENSCPILPYGWIQLTFKSFESENSPYINHESIIIGMTLLTALDLLYVFYLNGAGMVEDRFPSALAELYWTEVFLNKKNWKKTNVADTILYLQKLMYLSLISKTEFLKLLKTKKREKVNWKNLALRQAREEQVEQGYTFMPEKTEMIKQIKDKNHPAQDQLISIISWSSKNHNGQEIAYIKTMCFLFSRRYSEIMLFNMNSDRIKQTAQILGVEPVINMREMGVEVKNNEATTSF